MSTPPTGTVTFFFTDIEGSTQRWERHPEAMAIALERHNAILHQAIESHGGYVFKTVGDAFHAAFPNAAEAVAAAVDAQRVLHAETWPDGGTGDAPLQVRMALHTGLVEVRHGDYFGPPLNRTARLMAAAHGGQVLISLVTEELVRDALPVGCSLRDLGMHRLKDLHHSEHIFRVQIDDLPGNDKPLNTAEALPASERAVLDVGQLPTESPYRGLHAFREEDAGFFFGREAFTALLVEAVGRTSMVGVIGPSGSGKSSVVFAGLVPYLRAENGKSRWLIVELRPGGRPFQALAAVLVPLVAGSEFNEIDRLAEVNKLAGYLRDRTISPQDVLVRIGEKRPDIGRLLLVADQFEELYTLCPDEDEQRAFQDLVFQTAFDRGAMPVTLGLTLRADFMGHALAYRPFADAVQHHQVVLGPMNREELARAIRLPAEKQGRAFETGLVERIVDDVGEKSGSLPLLEFALTKLWDEQKGGWLTHDAYEQIGRVEGAVARHADTVYQNLSTANQERARRVFVQLVQPGEGTEDTRRLATRSELDEDWDLVGKLADARLVVTSRDEAGHETAEVVHEALIRSWEQLREWINADRRFRTWQERLRFALRQWEATRRDEGVLLRGAPLAEAEDWLGQRGAQLTPDERLFVENGVILRDSEAVEREGQRQRELQAAEQLAEAQRQRAENEARAAKAQALAAQRLRQRAVFLAVSLVAAAGLAIAAIAFAHKAQQNGAQAETAAQLSFARELAAASVSNLSVDPERSALLALRAISISEAALGTAAPEAERALHLALQQTRLRRTIVAHPDGVADVAVTPDGQRIVSCGSDGIKVWERTTGRLVLEVTQPMTAVTSVAISPDGLLIASGGPDGVARIFRLVDGSEVVSMTGHTRPILQVEFSPDGSRLATAGADATARIWDVATGRESLALRVLGKDVRSVAWRPDGRQLATASNEPVIMVRIWDVTTGKAILEITGPTLFVLSVAFTPDGNRIATASTTDARIWDARSGELLNILYGHDDELRDAVFSPDGELLLSGSADKTAGLWGIGTVVRAGSPLLIRLAGHSGQVRSVAFTPSGQDVVTASSDGTIKIWDISSRQAWRTMSGHRAAINGIAIAPDGQRIATGGSDGTVRIWDIASETPEITITGHTTSVYRVAFSPDGKTLATASKDRTAKLWDAQTGSLLQTFTGHMLDVTAVKFSPDGRRLVTGSNDKTAAVWDVATGARLLTLAGHTAGVHSVAFDPEGKRIATGSEDYTAKVWDSRTGQELRSLEVRGMVAQIRFSPDGGRILTASDSGRHAKIWDAATGTLLLTVSTFRRPIQGGDFSPDGTRFATSSWDGTVKLWDSATGEELLTVATAPRGLTDLAFSADGSHLVAGSYDLANKTGRAYVFTLRLDELVALGQAQVTRSLTDQECRVFLHMVGCTPQQ